MEPAVSGTVVFVAEAAARHRFTTPSIRGVRVFSREPRSSGQHRDRPPPASVRRSSEVAGAVDTASAWAVRAAAVPGTGGGRRAAIYLLCRPSGAACPNSCKEADSSFCPSSHPHSPEITRAASCSERRRMFKACRLDWRDTALAAKHGAVCRSRSPCARRMQSSRASGPRRVYRCFGPDVRPRPDSLFGWRRRSSAGHQSRIAHDVSMNDPLLAPGRAALGASVLQRAVEPTAVTARRIV